MKAIIVYYLLNILFCRYSSSRICYIYFVYCTFLTPLPLCLFIHNIYQSTWFHPRFSVGSCYSNR